MSERLFTQKYRYIGPTMLLGKYDNIELHTGDHVAAEVNINVATIEKIYTRFGTTVLNDAEVDVAAKYLKPIGYSAVETLRNNLSEAIAEVDKQIKSGTLSDAQILEKMQEYSTYKQMQLQLKYKRPS